MDQSQFPHSPLDTEIEAALRQGTSRRDILRLLTASGFAATSAGALLLRAGDALAATPRAGGSIRAAGFSASTADTLDPAKAALSTDYVRICAFYNRLTFLDQGGLPQMELAESIDSKDSQTWTVKLKKGITFHNGKTLTSTDVIYSLKRHLDPAVGSKVNSIAKQMTGFKVVDDLTVEITLAAPNADLPTILGLHHFMIVADGTTDFSKANGTGAFVCEAFEPGVRSIGVKNRNYFKPGKPYLDSFEFFGIADVTARINALLSGDIQLAASIKPQYLRLLEGKPGVALVQNKSGNYTNLNMRLDMAPGDKAGFAEGVKLLLDRDLILKSVLRGIGDIGNDQPIPPASYYHNPDLKPKSFDPEKAKFLFQKAGVLGETIPIVASDAADLSVEMATLLQRAGEKIGMKFDIQRVPSDGYWSNYWLKSPVHFGNINARPTPDIYFSLLYASDAPWNESKYKSEKFDKMLLEARGLLDQNKRKAIYHEMQVMIADAAGTAIPARIDGVDAVSSKLKGLETNPLGGMMGYAFAENVWLEA